MRIALLAFITGASLLTGCAANLKSVRDFADETKKISVAFDPLLAATVEQCKRKVETKLLYAGGPVRSFKPEEMTRTADDTCRSIAEANATAKKIDVVLFDYADKLSALAGDGVASSVDDDYDALSKKLADFKEIPKEKLTAVSALVKFLTKTAIAQAQKQAVAEALDHEEAVGVLGDALVLYTRRVYGGYLVDRKREIGTYSESIRDAIIAAPPLLAKLQLIELHKESLAITEQEKVIPSLEKSVAQMKASLKDLRKNLDRLSDKERRQEVEKLAKEVKALYQQLDKAF
jgi:DNA repair exonuclease SbcCD ATPase subunit